MKITGKKLLMRVPLLNNALRYLNNTIIPHTWDLRYSTIWSMRCNFPERPGWQATKLEASRSLFRDRQEEMKAFFNLTSWKLLIYFARNGTPNTHYFKWRLEQEFESSGLGREELKQTYASLSLRYTLRLMLGYHRYDLGEKVAALQELKGGTIAGMRLLDYGCGVADPALLLATRGAQVTIVDLEDKKFDFARWRFKVRALPVTAVAAYETERPVNLEQNYDVIIMSEFLEHVRNPQLFLEFAADHLEKGGILYDSLGPQHHAGTGGDHLPETKAIIESPAYLALHQGLFISANEFFADSGFKGFYLRR